MSPTRIHATTAQISFLGASCLMFSLLELSIPRFVPFFRLGLSNLPLMVALSLGLDLGSYLRLMALRLVAQAVVGGTLLSYVFVLSLASALASGLAMRALFRIRGLSFVGVSVGGAFCGNLAQCLAGTLFLGPNALALFVPVAGLGLVTGTALGLAANRFVRDSAFINVFRQGPPAVPSAPPGAGEEARPGGRRRGALAVLAGGALAGVLLWDSLWWRAAALAASWAALKAAGGRPRPWRQLLVVASVTALSLLSPFGEVIARLGGWIITRGALEAGLGRALLLCASMGLGGVLMRTVDFRKGRVLALVFAYVGVFREGLERNRTLMPLPEAADRTLVEACLGRRIDG